MRNALNEEHLIKSWDDSWAMHWICALKSWFLLHFSFIFFYVSSWNDIIKSQGKNLRSGDRRNYFHHISSDTSTCSNYFAFTLRNRYVVKEKFVQPLKIILKLKMSIVVRGSRLQAILKFSRFTCSSVLTVFVTFVYFLNA